LPPVAAPTAIWPLCGQPATARACAEAAETIFRRMQPNHPAILALCSPADGDGKTNLMVALAPELAKRTGGALVIDADSHNADLTNRLTLSTAAARPGSADLIYPTNQPGLYVMPIRSRPASTNDGRKRTALEATGVRRQWDRDWFDDLRERWPLALFDTASLEHVEASPILRYCDGAYLVVRLGHTALRAVGEAARVIRARGGRLLGNVVVG